MDLLVLHQTDEKGIFAQREVEKPDNNEAGLSDLVRKLGHFILLGQDGVLGIHFLKGILQIFHKN